MAKEFIAIGLASFFALATAHFAAAQYQSGQDPQTSSQGPQTSGQTRPSWQDQGQTTRDREMTSEQQAAQDQNEQYRAGSTAERGQTGQYGQDQAASPQEQRSTREPENQPSQDHSKQKQASGSKEKTKKQQAASMYLDANKLIGATVKDRNGKDTGSVSNLILDRSGKVIYVVVSEGGFAGLGAKKISVPAGAVTVSANGDKQLLTVNVDEQHLKAAPEYISLANLSDPLYAETIYRFFGLQPQWSEQDQGGSVQGAESEESQQLGNQNQWRFQEQQTPQGQQRQQESSGR